MFFISFQLCLFAEGTRFTKEKHKVSVQFSKENGFPVLKHHLLPRPKGFTFLVNNLNDTSDYYNSTVQDDLLAREIFGEFVSEIQLADFILAILL